MPPPVRSKFRAGRPQAKAKFVTGLSATVTRKDGHHPIVFMQCGPVRHRVDAEGAGGRASLSNMLLSSVPLGFGRCERQILTCAIQFQDLYRGTDCRRKPQSPHLRRSRRGCSAGSFAARLDRTQRASRFLGGAIVAGSPASGGSARRNGQKRTGGSHRYVGRHPANEERGAARDRPLYRRRIRRRAAGHPVPDAAGLVAWNDCAVCGPIAPPATTANVKCA